MSSFPKNWLVFVTFVALIMLFSSCATLKRKKCDCPSWSMENTEKAAPINQINESKG